MNREHWPSPKLLLRDHLIFAGMTAVGLLITIIGIEIAYDIYSDHQVDQSFWNEVASSVAPWYAASIGVYLMVVSFPAYVLYGETRRRFAGRVALFAGPFVAGLSLLALAGLLIERLVYRIAGWEHAIGEDHLYSSATDVLRFVLEFVLVLSPWFAFGAVLGAAYIGRQELLIALIPLAIVAVATVNVLLGLDNGPGYLAERFIDPSGNNILAGVVASLGLSAAAIYGVRWIIRDVAIKTQSS